MKALRCVLPVLCLCAAGAAQDNKNDQGGAVVSQLSTTA